MPEACSAGVRLGSEVKDTVLSPLCAFIVLATPGARADVLVAMHTPGRIERYEAATGRWVGTFADGIASPNCLLWGRDGSLLVSTGGVGGAGSVRRYDRRTGAYLGELIAVPNGQPGHLARATGLAWYGGDLLVASCDDGRVYRYDGLTGAFLGEAAEATAGGITEIAVRGDDLLVTDFRTQSIRCFHLTVGGETAPLVTQPGFSPWSLELDSAGRLFWGGSDGTVRRLAGGTDAAWAGRERSLGKPIHLALGPDGLLYGSALDANRVTVWDPADDSARPRLVIGGPEMQTPMGIVFTTEPVVPKPVVQLARVQARPHDPPVSWRLEARTHEAKLTSLGWDTEGGSRSALNLLRSAITLDVLREGHCLAPDVQFSMADPDTLTYRLDLGHGAALRWSVSLRDPGLVVGLRGDGRARSPADGVVLRLPLSPPVAATCVVADDWTEDGRARLPFLLHAPDIGTLRVSCPQLPDLAARWEGSRSEQTATLLFDLPTPKRASGFELLLEPVALPPPDGLEDLSRWESARRGWLNLLQLSTERSADGPGRDTPPGVWANNIISDPVCNTLYFLADHVLLMPELAEGVSAPAILRRAVEFWMARPADESGRLPYTVADAGSRMADANPAVLIGAWAYVEATGDDAWLAGRIDVLEAVGRYTERRDVDGDGLVESEQSGNRGTHAFGDTAWDTISSGHKNAYVNALAYRAWRGLADLEGRLDRTDRAAHYARLADRLQAAYVPTFYSPALGFLGWWRSEDGQLHELVSDVPTSMAVNCGVMSPERGRAMLLRYLAALDSSGFDRFDLGVPTALKPVHRDDQFSTWGGQVEDGSDTFGKYLNGGCCVSNTSYLLQALYRVGLSERADRILDAMLARQRDGVFANGGGFQNGVVDRYPDGAEFFDWAGNTCGYEGHLVYSWAFLQAVLLREARYRDRLLPTP